MARKHLSADGWRIMLMMSRAGQKGNSPVWGRMLVLRSACSCASAPQHRRLLQSPWEAWNDVEASEGF